MPALPPPHAAPPPAVARQRLQQRLLLGLTLDERPFDTAGAALGMEGDAVIDLLRQWVGQGRIACIGLVWDGPPPPPADALDEDLLAACASGLPLLRQPWEALGAMLGVPASQVQARLGEWRQSGRLLRIAAVPVPPLPPAP